jgi:excisionase family DNA binding protein
MKLMHITRTSSWPDSALAELGETLTVRQAAAALATTPRAIRDLIGHPDHEHRLPAVKLGRAWVIGRVDLREYLLKHRNMPSTVERGRGR